jgi:putative transposase
MEKIITVNEAEIRDHLGELVRGTVEETLNALLDAEAEKLCGAGRYERSEARQDYRSGHYQRKLETKAGSVTLNVPKLRSSQFETAIIERYRRRESSVEEALIEMYLAGVSVRRVEDITEALWGSRVSATTISDLNQKAYGKIEEWRQRPLTEAYPYVYLDGVFLKRRWGDEVVSVSVLVAIGVSEDGFRNVLGAMEGAREDKESWRGFLVHLKERGLRGVRLMVSDKHLGFVEAVGEVFPEASWQRCMVHFYRNVFRVVPHKKVKDVAAMLKAIHAQEDIVAAREKAGNVVRRLLEMKLPEAAGTVERGIGETLTYMRFPREHWLRIRTNNVLERLNREIKRRTRVVGCFPDGSSALMLVCARLRYVAGREWGTKRYLNMELLQGHEPMAIAA